MTISCRVLEPEEEQSLSRKAKGGDVEARKHCHRVLSLAPRGICMTCYRCPEIKELYAPTKVKGASLVMRVRCAFCAKEYPDRGKNDGCCSRKCASRNIAGEQLGVLPSEKLIVGPPQEIERRLDVKIRHGDLVIEVTTEAELRIVLATLSEMRSGRQTQRGIA